MRGHETAADTSCRRADWRGSIVRAAISMPTSGWCDREPCESDEETVRAASSCDGHTAVTALVGATRESRLSVHCSRSPRRIAFPSPQIAGRPRAISGHHLRYAKTCPRVTGPLRAPTPNARRRRRAVRATNPVGRRRVPSRGDIVMHDRDLRRQIESGELEVSGRCPGGPRENAEGESNALSPSGCERRTTTIRCTKSSAFACSTVPSYEN